MQNDRIKEAGKHGYAGSCAPDIEGERWETFSVGIFEWVPTSNGKGVKKGKVKLRVKGYANRTEGVYAVAEYYCSIMDKGETCAQKTVWA